MDAATLALMIPILALMIPVVAICVKPFGDAMRKRERDEARRTYERIALQKLDVIKTALTMGYSQAELHDLDARLERLIGADKLQGLLAANPQTPVAALGDSDMLDTDLDSEVQRQKAMRRDEQRNR